MLLLPFPYTLLICRRAIANYLLIANEKVQLLVTKKRGNAWMDGYIKRIVQPAGYEVPQCYTVQLNKKSVNKGNPFFNILSNNLRKVSDQADASSMVSFLTECSREREDRRV